MFSETAYRIVNKGDRYDICTLNVIWGGEYFVIKGEKKRPLMIESPFYFFYRFIASFSMSIRSAAIARPAALETQKMDD